MRCKRSGTSSPEPGSVAVFVTLGYLAVQVKHARSQAQRTLSQARAEALREIYAEQRDERMNLLLVNTNAALGGKPSQSWVALMEQAGVTAEEASLLHSMFIAWWNYRLQIIPYVDELPAMERTMFDVGIRTTLNKPGVYRTCYETGKRLYHPDAVRYVDNLLAQPG